MNVLCNGIWFSFDLSINTFIVSTKSLKPFLNSACYPVCYESVSSVSLFASIFVRPSNVIGFPVIVYFFRGVFFWSREYIGLLLFFSSINLFILLSSRCYLVQIIVAVPLVFINRLYAFYLTIVPDLSCLCSARSTLLIIFFTLNILHFPHFLLIAMYYTVFLPLYIIA